MSLHPTHVVPVFVRDISADAVPDYVASLRRFGFGSSLPMQKTPGPAPEFSELLQARFLCGLAHLDDNTHNKLNIRFSCLANLKAGLLWQSQRVLGTVMGNTSPKHSSNS